MVFLSAPLLKPTKTPTGATRKTRGTGSGAFQTRARPADGLVQLDAHPHATSKLRLPAEADLSVLIALPVMCVCVWCVRVLGPVLGPVLGLACGCSCVLSLCLCLWLCVRTYQTDLKTPLVSNLDKLAPTASSTTGSTMKHRPS